jgi:hypothetical protein
MPDADLGRALVVIARASIGTKLGFAADEMPRHEALAQPAATFVTLKQDEQLRGCIGSLEARRPLGVDVRENALAAAFRDPRFPPLAAIEFEATGVEVSLLSASESIDVASEEELVARLRPGVDGVIIEHGHHRATFLPQVWESLPEPWRFLAALKRKAGLPERFWSGEMKVARYGVVKWAQGEFLAGEEWR